jgi:S-formylglutathione hydrolase FrmB
MGVRAISGLLLVMVVGGSVVGNLEAGAAVPGTDTTTTVPPIKLVSRTTVSPRLQELTLATSTVPGGTDKVRVLVPKGYSTSTKRYPVLYLYHGGLEDETAWTEEGDVVALTSGYPLIVVMPADGSYGYYTNWYNDGDFGVPQWETFQNQQLVAWIDQHYRTIPSRTQRAAAGVSLGGFGSFANAARYPDLWGAVASFSGAVDVTTTENQTILSPVSKPIFGTWADDEIRWRGNNPTDLAANLSNTSMALYVGNGNPAQAFDLEVMVHQEAINMNEKLDDLNIPHIFDDYGTGEHSWTYWKRDLTWWLPHLMHYFSETPATATVPRKFTYVSMDPSYNQWGWTVAIDRPSLEFSALEVDGKNQFSVIGSGTASVTSGAGYSPGGKYKLSITDAKGTSKRTVTANSKGRLTVSLDLGPGNPAQQYTTTASESGSQSNGDAANVVENPPFYTSGAGSLFYKATVKVAS